MRRGWGILSLVMVTLLVLLLALGGGGQAKAEAAIVRLYFFYAEECEHCQAIKGELFPTLLARYGDQLEIVYREISDTAIFKEMVALEKQFGVPAEKADVPEVFVGDQALVGEQEIRNRLPSLIDQLLAQGGAGLPGQVAMASQDSGEGVVRFYLFYSETCPHCHEIMENYLPTVYEKYGDQVEYEYIDIHNNTENYMLMLGLETRLGIPQEEQGYVPVLFIGDKALIGGGEIPEKLEGYIDEYLAQGGVDFPSLENLPQVAPPSSAPTVQILVFVDSERNDFEALNSVMKTLVQRFEGALQPFAIDITVAENADTLAQINDALGVSQPPAGTPEVLIDHRLLVGIDEIELELAGLVTQYLEQGGVAVPSWEELMGADAPPPPGGAQNTIYLAYFEQAGCQECARTTYDLDAVKEQYPQLEIESFAIEEEENKALNEWLSEQYGVPEEKRLSTPMIFVGDDVLIGSEANLENLLAAVAKYTETGTERIWEDFSPEEGEQGILDRFKSFGVLTVLGAGLIDGLNPCAFATLVFLISYLAFTGRKGRDILFVGLAFTLGVFLTYLLVGVGLLQVIQSLSFFSTLGRWVYLLTALLCLVLAILTFRDYFKAREGQASEMALKLPTSLRRRINKVIRENSQVRAFVAVAFFTGFVVSLLELACTGQVYLPTIIYVTSQPELASQAFLYLLLYCLMFILPLVIVFLLAYFGTTSEQLGQFINRHTATIKFVTGLLFVGLTLWMTWTLLPLFGVHSPWTWVIMAVEAVIIVAGVILLRLRDHKTPSRSRDRKRRGAA